MKEIVIYLTANIRKSQIHVIETQQVTHQTLHNCKSQRNTRFLAPLFPTFMWLVTNHEAKNLTRKHWSANTMTTKA